jgi:hypothetical protein
VRQEAEWFGAQMAAVSFANDMPATLFKYRGQMAWRLDLASYDDVKANADIILGQLGSDPPGMPPFDPFPPSFLAAFEAWQAAGYPR